MKKIKKGFELKDVCGERIIVAQGIANIDFSKVINLNETAAYLWTAVADQEFDERILAEHLVQEYDVETATALEDAQELIEEWEGHGLIEEV